MSIMTAPTSDQHTPQNTRRSFVKQMSLAAAFAFPAVVPSSAIGANAPSNRVHVGALGVGNRGWHVCDKLMAPLENVRFVAVCDAYESRRQRAKKEWDGRYGGDYVTMYTNPWDLLERKDIDAVVIATPDHWHAPLAIAAARAGKHIYVEKPLSVAMKWSWKLREAVKKGDVIVQYGTQQRSAAQFAYVNRMVREGRIGEVERVEAWCPDISTQYDDFKVYQYGSLRPAPPPADLYYDLWCGPSPLRPYTVDRCTEFGAYHIHDYALGFIAGWGAHPLDIAQWGLNADDTSPVFYEGGGSLPDYGLTDTTETWDITCYYDSGVLMRFMSHRVAQPVVMKYRKRWSSHGTTFFGKEGWISVDRGGLESSNESLAKFQMPNDGVKEYDRSEHQRNFIDCVRNHKQPVSPLEAGIRSDTISHLSDIVVRLKRPIQWDPKREAIVGDEEASKMLDRPMRKRWRI